MLNKQESKEPNIKSTTVTEYFAAAMSSVGKSGYYAATQPIWDMDKKPHYTKTYKGFQTSRPSMLPTSPYLGTDEQELGGELHKCIADCNPYNIQLTMRGNIRELASNYSSQNDPHNSTPIMLLVRTLQTEFLIELLDKALSEENKGNFDLKDLNLHLQDKDGRTVLHYAYALGRKNKDPNKDVVLKLLEINNKLLPEKKFSHIKDNSGKTPLDLALTITEQEIIQILVNLEIHPDRAFNAVFNAVQSSLILEIYLASKKASSKNEYLKNTEILREIKIAPFMLQNKKFLQGLQKCSDYKELFSPWARKFIEALEVSLKDITITEQCMMWVKFIRKEHEEASKKEVKEHKTDSQREEQKHNEDSPRAESNDSKIVQGQFTQAVVKKKKASSNLKSMCSIL